MFFWLMPLVIYDCFVLGFSPFIYVHGIINTLIVPQT